MATAMARKTPALLLRRATNFGVHDSQSLESAFDLLLTLAFRKNEGPPVGTDEPPLGARTHKRDRESAL